MLIGSLVTEHLLARYKPLHYNYNFPYNSTHPGPLMQLRNRYMSPNNQTASYIAGDKNYWTRSVYPGQDQVTADEKPPIIHDQELEELLQQFKTQHKVLNNPSSHEQSRQRLLETSQLNRFTTDLERMANEIMRLGTQMMAPPAQLQPYERQYSPSAHMEFGTLLSPLAQGAANPSLALKYMQELEKELGLQMKIDVVTEPNDYLVQIELPGVNKSNIDIKLEHGYLIVKAERLQEYSAFHQPRIQSNQSLDKASKQNITVEKQRPNHVERTYGMITRAIRLPSDADMSRIEAKFEVGVLHIKIPKMLQKFNMFPHKVIVQ
jgi:HSP20 family molecular chaperone IbpA